MNDIETIRQAARLIIAAAYTTSLMTLGALIPPSARRYRERIRSPRLGDWVYESSTIGHVFLPDDHPRFRDPVHSVGRLIAYEWGSRWLDDADPDARLIVAEHKGQPCRPDYWTIQTLTGDLFRWGNCDIITIPDHLRGFPGLWDNQPL